jgi:hypothetical protein
MKLRRLDPKKYLNYQWKELYRRNDTNNEEMSRPAEGPVDHRHFLGSGIEH